MEVAGQWRREWAGTAEYGKVTEGGVTRRVARAMEVLHASAPGARVRVMRAAYHSTSGPGVPASSYMLHSSRRVISSGFNILESPTFPSKPLEISSTPLESSPESNKETENYKVTEPDDMDISAPSKWRGTTGGNSIRMPSEESSSTDNASIIDLDSRLHHKGLNRKYSYDSENSDAHSSRRNSARASPLLDAPVTLSTLKYKTLLNNSNDWNNRRKSYSFEDTSPLNEIMVQSNDTLAMESSTDSGICKSSEIVNEHTEDSHNTKDFIGRENILNFHRNDSDDWFKIRPSPFYKGSRLKTYKEHDTVVEDPRENNVALQSTGKVTITVPITIEGEDDDKHSKFFSNEDNDRKVKKVEFCKTELHFAAESGRVNIIATDEKPPPSQDFRKRRSAFVPISNKFEKPVTLFGEKNDLSEKTKFDEYGIRELNEPVEFDENTAATKSILKNKIPKPKPYLLGENMVLGETPKINTPHDRPVALGVSLINKELETQQICHSKETVYDYGSGKEKSLNDYHRTFNKGLLTNTSSSIEKHNQEKRFLLQAEATSNNDSIRQKLSALNMSPVQKPKTRQLRESDLTFFGIRNNDNSYDDNKMKYNDKKTTRSEIGLDFIDDTFESVRLIKQFSASAQNSEAESDDSPDYQNIPIKTDFAPVPIPRSRVKYKKPDNEVMVLKPIIEQVCDSSRDIPESHHHSRSRSRKQDEIITLTNRSRSVPAKNKECYNTSHKSTRHNATERSKQTMTDVDQNKSTQEVKNVNYKTSGTEYDVPVYANIGASEIKEGINGEARKRVRDLVKSVHKNGTIEPRKENCKSPETDLNSLERRKNHANKNNRIRRTEKLSTPEYTNTNEKRKDFVKNVNSINGSISNSYKKKTNRQQPTTTQQSSKENQLSEHGDKKEKIIKHEEIIKDNIRMSKNRNQKNVEYSKSSRSENLTSDKHNNSKDRLITIEDSERGTNSNSRRPSRRTEYVIKYDDKNGTVSSISKVRAGHSTSRQKHTSKDRNKENSRDAKAKSKNSEKSALRK